jgi:hypothetical protein
MVFHPAISVKHQPILLHSLGQDIFKTAVVFIPLKNSLFCISPEHDMINSARVMNSRFSCHGNMNRNLLYIIETITDTDTDTDTKNSIIYYVMLSITHTIPRQIKKSNPVSFCPNNIKKAGLTP